jgi:hypothetical protein
MTAFDPKRTNYCEALDVAAVQERYSRRPWPMPIGPEPAWSKARPLLFCRETARYYHRLFAAT